MGEKEKDKFDDRILPLSEYGSDLSSFVDANRIKGLADLAKSGKLMAFVYLDPLTRKEKFLKVFDKNGNLVYFEDIEAIARIESPEKFK